MQRIRIGPAIKEKQPNEGRAIRRKIKDRIDYNMDLIKERKESKMSAGELVIAEFLKKNLVDFEREYYDPVLVNKYTNSLLFFDFYLPKYKLVIEFDGIYHYKPIEGADALSKQIRRDNIKNRYCKNKGIKILRIPYWESKKIEETICKYFDKHF